MKRAYGLRNAIALAPKLSLNALKANITSLKSRLASGQGSAAQKTEARAIIRVLEKARKSLIEVMGKEVAAEYVRRHGPLKKNPKLTTAKARSLAYDTSMTKPLRKARLYAVAAGRYPKAMLSSESYRKDLAELKAKEKAIRDLMRDTREGKGAYRKNPLTRRAFMASKAYGKSTAAMSMLEKAALHPGEWLHIPNKPHFNQPARELRHEGRNVQKSEVKGCLYKIKFR